MNTKEPASITSISDRLAAKCGAHGTPECAEFDEQAYAFYTSAIIQEACKDAKLTQAELAQRLGTTKSYISRIEHGNIVPSAATFYRIAHALGFTIQLVPTADI